MSGSATSAAETVSGNARDVRDVQAQMNTANLGPSTMPQGAQDYRSEFIAAGGGQRVNPGFFDSRNVVSPQELALARAYDPAAFRASRRSGIMDFFTSGGLLGVYEPYDPEKNDYDQVQKIQGPEPRGIGKLMEVLGNIPTPLNLLRKAFEGVGPGFIGPKGSRAYGDESLFFYILVDQELVQNFFKI
jgi:hypothetical protein